MKKGKGPRLYDYILKPFFQLCSLNEFIAEGYAEIIEYCQDAVVMNISGVSEVLRVRVCGKELHISFFSKSSVRICGIIEGISLERRDEQC